MSNHKLGHLNVNSLRHKFDPLSEAMRKCIFDILMLQETKLEDSFPDSQCATEGFKMYRKDVKSDTGGLIMSEVIFPRRELHNDAMIETLAVEVVFNDEKWLVCSIYKQPKVKDGNLVRILSSLLDTFSADYTKFILVGDINVDVRQTKRHCLSDDVFEVNGVKNIVSSPTCFKNRTSPSTIDLVITNVHKRFNKRPRGLDALLGHLLIKRMPVIFQLSSTKIREYLSQK